MDFYRHRPPLMAESAFVNTGTPQPDLAPSTSAARLRLKGRTSQGRPSKKFDGWLPWPMGAAFIAFGLVVITRALGVIPSDPSKFYVPQWALCVSGGLFFLCGLLVWFGAVAARRRLARLAKWAAAHPDEPAMADFRWNPNGASMPRWDEFRKAVLCTSFLVGFLFVFNWWVLFSDGCPFLVKILVGLSNVVLLAVIWGTVATLIRACKFSPGCVTWKRFPVRPEDPINLTWNAPADDKEGWTSGSFVLRCVEGYRDNSLPVQDELWSQKIEVGPSAPGLPLHLTFHPPPNLPETCITGRRPLFWELDLELETPGLNRHERILIPVYKKDARNPASVIAMPPSRY